jgi:hypothetical protein
MPLTRPAGVGSAVRSLPMSELTPLDLVHPLLADDERVWAVYPGSRALVATNRRLFFVVHEHVDARDLSDFTQVRRERESLIVLSGQRGGPSIAIEVGPDDEAGLQALTVLGLLVACPERVPGDPPADPPVEG